MITRDMVSKSEKEHLKQHIEELREIETNLFSLGGHNVNSALSQIWADLFSLVRIVKDDNE